MVLPLPTVIAGNSSARVNADGVITVPVLLLIYARNVTVLTMAQLNALNDYLLMTL